jgi:hypothetical protein
MMRRHQEHGHVALSSEARKLDSREALLDYNDVKAGRETPAERRARE